MSKPHNPEEIIEDLGGCGRFQLRLVIITHFVKSVVSFAYTTLLVSAKTPPWRCQDVPFDMNISRNGSDPMSKSCSTYNGTACTNFVFDGPRTVVSQFGLVCDQAFIPSLLMSLHAFGMLFGNPIGGQLADLFGRKFPYFAGVFMIGVGSLIAYFSTHLIMFGACRFFIGIGAGFFMTVQYSLMSEFTLAKWRTWIVNFPSWQIQSSAFALLGWLIDDWQYLHILCTGVAVVCLLCWWVIPESFRWYIAHDRHDDARRVLEGVAKVNKRKLKEISTYVQASEDKPDRKYTFRDLFRTRYLVKITLLSALNWFALGLVAFALHYGIQALSGNVYFNVFLFAVTSMPIKIIASFLLNKIGRRRSSIACFVVTCIGGLAAAAVQRIDTPYRGLITNISAMTANMGIQGAWGTVQTMTVEVYPTVIRNIGFGTQSTVARIAATIGPQLVYVEYLVPGAMYLICGVLSFLCIIGLFFLPETMDANLSDKIQQGQELGQEICPNLGEEIKDQTLTSGSK